MGSFALLFHEEPRVIKNTATDHRSVELMLAAFFASFMNRFNVAVADNGDVGCDLIAEASGFRQSHSVGGTNRHLFLGASVEGEGGGSGF